MNRRRCTVPALALAAGLLGACASLPPEQLFSADGPAWPPAPAPARLQWLGEFSRPADLGMRPSLWERVVAIATGPRDQRLVQPVNVVVAEAQQQIYVADPGIAGVHRFDLRRHRYRQLRLPDNSPLPSPVGLAIGPESRVFVADSQLGMVFVAGPRATALQPFSEPGALQQPTGLAWDADAGVLLVVDTGAQAIVRLAEDGREVARIGSRGNGAGQLNFPTFLWLRGDTELLVSDSLNFRVQRLDAAGRPLGSFGVRGDVSGSFARPKGLATDSDGHVYVMDALFHAMQIFAPDGRLLLAVGEQGQGPGEFWLPAGIFIDSQDRIYVADSFNRRVQVFQYLGGGE